MRPMDEDWIEPPELLAVRLVLATSAAVGLLIGFGGVVTGAPLDTAFLGVTVVLLIAASRMRLEHSLSIRFAAIAARLSAAVWIWLELKIESPGNVAVFWVWLAVAACFLSARHLLRFAFPDERRQGGGETNDGESADRPEAWIEELPA